MGAGNRWDNVDKTPLNNNEENKEKEEREEEGEGAKVDKSVHDNDDDDDNEEVIRGEPAFLLYSTILWATRWVESVAPRAGIID